jgi:hypothetical protein
MNYYVIDTNCHPSIYIAKDDKSFMKFFIKNFKDFEYIFSDVGLTNASFFKSYPELFEIRDDEKTYLRKVKRLVKKMSFDEFSTEISGECNDGNCVPYIVIDRITDDRITYID